jgi:predicted DNA-binding transcriptional regulator YafY
MRSVNLKLLTSAVAASLVLGGAGFLQNNAFAATIEKETAAIADQVTAGKLTQEQAEQMKAGLSDRLAQRVAASAIGSDGGFGYGKGGGFGRFARPEELAPVLGMTEDEIKAGLESGKSIAELAAAKGLTEEQLIRKLKDRMTDQLKTWVNAKRSATNNESMDGKEVGVF